MAIPNLVLERGELGTMLLAGEGIKSWAETASSSGICDDNAGSTKENWCIESEIQSEN